MRTFQTARGETFGSLVSEDVSISRIGGLLKLDRNQGFFSVTFFGARLPLQTEALRQDNEKLHHSWLLEACC